MAPNKYRAAAVEYVAAMKSVRCAKNVFFLLLVLGILTELTGFAVMVFTSKLDAAHGPAAGPFAMVPTTGTAQTRPEIDPNASRIVQSSAMWKYFLGTAMKIGRFVAPVAAGLATASLLVGLLVTLVGRMDGAGGLSSALFWSLLLLALLIPWHHAFVPEVGPGAMYSLSELTAAAGPAVKGWGGGADGWDRTLFHARFAGYPLVALLALLAVQMKFARGYKRMIASTVIDAAPPEPGEDGAAEDPQPVGVEEIDNPPREN